MWYIYIYSVWACISVLVLGPENNREQPVSIIQGHLGIKSRVSISHERTVEGGWKIGEASLC